MTQGQCTPDIETMRRLCRLANREAFAYYENRGSCIFTSTVLRDVLETLGIHAELMRVEVVGIGRNGAVILGSDGDGERLPPPPPGMWHGHLTVVAGHRFLMDATLDQIRGLKPFVGEVTDEWLQEQGTLWFVDGERTPGFPGYDLADSPRTLRYHSYPGRGGWKGAPAFRNRTHRRRVVDAILSKWEG